MSIRTKRAPAKSLKALGKEFADSNRQIEVLNDPLIMGGVLPKFSDKLGEIGLSPLYPTKVDIFQVNVGKMCNMICKHCHVDAGPDRKEIMTRETMQACLDVLEKYDIGSVDLTGGAPEMNPDFRWFVEEISKMGRHIIVRCNLTIIVANRKFNDLPEFFAKHGIEVVSSLPHYTPGRTDRQRGDGTFRKSIQALNMLNDAGYGKPGTGLELNLVYNPTGAFLPGNQEELEREYKRRLKTDFDIDFNHLFAITNLPVSRFLDYLVASKNIGTYMEKLIGAYNPSAAMGVMCRNTVSISWDGYLFDCDFNQMLEIPVQTEGTHISQFDLEALEKREIAIDQHCFGCTAGAGSSCGGQTA
ncbi:MAG: arsenosugar biosynthesis radical SAM (seleno)protein ArsS [Salibacteraceae bacterium]